MCATISNGLQLINSEAKVRQQIQTMEITPLVIASVIGLFIGGATYYVLIRRAKIQNAQWLAIEGMSDGTLLIGPDGQVTEVNAAALGILGLSRRQVRGQKMEKVKFVSQFTQITESREQVQINDQWYEFRISPLNIKHNYLGRMIIIHNITDKKQAEDTQSAFLNDMKALQEIHLALSEISVQETLYVKMIELARSRLNIERIGLFLLDQSMTELMGTFGVDDDGNIRDERYFSERISEGHWTFEILNAPNHAKVWRDAPIYDNNKVVGTGWKAATALWNGHQAVGYIVCDCFISQRAERRYELELISVLGSIYGHLIEDMKTEKKVRLLNQRLEHMAMTDELTGLYNRRYYHSRIQEEFKRGKRHKGMLSLLALDIDHFKQINDTYGHESGDLALKHVADILKDTLRTTDIVARVGGEEFAILTINTDLDSAKFLAERVRKIVEKQSHIFPDRNLTISIGVATLEPSIRDVEELLKNADLALYAAKHSGRNCVRVAPHAMESEIQSQISD
jgi:diguanylate cyclase (GGDEF)-like protein/PAS domain S-box-containing protein